jgi:hypothetical protein
MLGLREREWAAVLLWIMAERRILGWRMIELYAGFPTLAWASIELRLDAKETLFVESSEGLDCGVDSLSSGTGVGGFTGRPLFALRDDSIGVE